MTSEPPISVTALTERPVRVLLLDDEPMNLLLRAAILRQHGYHCVPTSSIEEATDRFDEIDIAVLDYHLGAGQFGSEAAALLRRRRPYVPIIILSATVERYFGGVEDMHLLKGYSSVEDLLAALRSLEAKHRGSPVVVDARDFFYSRLSLSIGLDVLVQIFDEHGTWQFCNDTFADYLDRARDWFPGHNPFEELPTLMQDWRGILHTVAVTRETHIDRTHRSLLNLPSTSANTPRNHQWSVLAFPITLHDGRNGVVLTARVMQPPPRPDLNLRLF
jgi:CheY-like chemotaxis protein